MATAAGAALGVLAMFGRKAAVQSPTALAGDWMDGLIAEHQAVLKLFDALEATDDKAADHRSMLLAQIKHALAKYAIEKVRQFRADLEDHMRDEENELFPTLRAQVGEEKNKHLTAAMNKEGFKVA